MFRKIALALVATSLLAAPALAKTTKTVHPHAGLAAHASSHGAGKSLATVKKHRIHLVHQVKRHRMLAGKHRYRVYAVKPGARVVAGHHRQHLVAGKHGYRVYLAKHRHPILAGKHRAHLKHIVTLKTNTVKVGKTFKAKAQFKTHINRTVKVKKVRTSRTAVRAA